ncbi:hypothetical protein GCM10017744_014320 [Streptomyces antimycoticus]|uniref:Uncharacterized protein n=1 Tax=Streptomyces antimycoticus TaxID=68175 RepID=A0A4D4KPM3_9ACTN|nr:hypothetical protein [Streptomyces antimycoticus]GDY47813.1 hypothetical protein SANT12839_086950 [Streptomyces antimycoticus]
MPIDVYAAMRAMMRAEATRRPVTPQARTTDPSPPLADPAAPDPVDTTAQDVSEAVPAPTSAPAPSAAPRPVRRSRPARYLSRCRAVLRAVRHAVSACITRRVSRQGR